MKLPHLPCILWWALALWTLASHCGPAGAFFSWLRKAAVPPAPVAPDPVGDAVPQFEMALADEKFLAEAKLMELSPLDSCHYRVIAQLKSTCSSLSEEQLAKLGVVLFNCQSEVEGRRTYPCTEEMTLKQCTADMDADTWNAYHIVSNRARSVCYATRQQHFRRRAEVTVNALIATATNQLDAMKDLKEGQQELKELTAASLEKLLLGHGALQEQQGQLRVGQEQMESSITSNLERLNQERALIASGQELVARLIQGITQRMENVTNQLKGQGSDLHDGHRAILEDLAEVRGRAQDIYSKMEDNLSGFLKYQNRTAQYYTELMGKLERMNGTLGYMLRYLDGMQGRLEERLYLIQSYLGWAGMSLSALWVCAVHAGYFLLVALLLCFLHCPCFSRAALLVSVPLNAAAELSHQPSLDMMGLSLLLVSLSLGHWFLLQLLRGVSRLGVKKPALAPPLAQYLDARPKSPKRPRLSHSTPERYAVGSSLALDHGPLLARDSFSYDDHCLTGTDRICEAQFIVPNLGSPSHSTPRTKRRPSLPAGVLEGFAQRHLGAVLDAVGESSCCSSPNQSLGSNSSASGRRLCQGTTKTGHPCKKRAILGQDYCRIHEGGHTSYAPLTPTPLTSKPEAPPIS
ncbi:protein brambleberry isoform X1 [Brienomyrus brachyistius]|uniref:protein brambleberry isoform X1 n=2 Tax=Brienomyrus brachyistius TaxID=42636 RepID=UPI0020B1E327|nr:protein brambleberry isoform X1 [Brienomyrus brachyistius]